MATENYTSILHFPASTTVEYYQIACLIKKNLGQDDIVAKNSVELIPSCQYYRHQYRKYLINKSARKR